MDEDEDPYESLPGVGRNTIIYMTAGAMAGLLEHCIMYPIDVVRTRMQSIKPQVAHQSFMNTVVQVVKTEKFRTFRGMAAVVTGAGPAHALYFSCYENLKQAILGNNQNQHSSTQRGMAHFVSGVCATVVHDAIMNPVEVVKQRMQMQKSPFRNSLTCTQHILKTEGFRAFYRSYATQLAMNVPYQSLHFVTYEILQDLTNKNRDYNPKAHMISGGVAGALAAAVTTPLDVCKTLLNTQESIVLAGVKTNRITGLSNALKIVYNCCGFKGFFRGLQARVVVSIPSTAISWSVYEFFKYHYTPNSSS